jgi:nucleoside 2-deoxyribosyltransferase
MKVYVTARFKGDENKSEIEQLCRAVQKSGMQDFCFVRDVENYRKTFDNPKELWTRALQEIKNCDALLIDVSDAPSGGRVVEVGIAYALNLPIFVAARKDTNFKELYSGVATKILSYDRYDDITPQLKRYLDFGRS